MNEIATAAFYIGVLMQLYASKSTSTWACVERVVSKGPNVPPTPEASQLSRWKFNGISWVLIIVPNNINK